MGKILLITSRADYGGGPEHIKQLISNLNSEFKFHIATPGDEPYFEVFKKYGSCIEIPHRKFSARSLISLFKVINEHGIDIIHSHGRGGGIYSRILGLMTGKPVVHTFHGFHYQHLKPLKRWLYLSSEKLLANFTNIFINVSESEKVSCLNAGIVSKDKVVVVPNGIRIPAFTERILNKGKLTLVNISRLSPEKGVAILLDIVKSLSLLYADFNLVIIGDGPERAHLKKKAYELGIEKYISFLGFRKDVSGILASADIYVTASRGEGMPLTVLEAMVRSLPVVASNVVGIVDLVEQGKNGFLFDINRPEQAAEYIMKLIKDNALYESMAKNAYQTVADNYTIEKMCKKIANVYNTILVDA